MEMRKMTDLERRALLGDKQAQEECTEKGIVLSCPFCGNTEVIVGTVSDLEFMDEFDENYEFYKTMYMVFCPMNKDGCGSSICRIGGKNKSIAAWNTRPAPSIGRCGECKHSWNQDEYGYINCTNLNVIMKQDDYCSLFEHKETKLNEKL